MHDKTNANTLDLVVARIPSLESVNNGCPALKTERDFYAAIIGGDKEALKRVCGRLAYAENVLAAEIDRQDEREAEGEESASYEALNAFTTVRCIANLLTQMQGVRHE